MKKKLDLKEYIYSVPDFPEKGVLFRDITPLMLDPEALKETILDLAAFAREVGAELIIGPEARGFIFGCAVAYEINVGFAPIRKPGKLPREIVSESYTLEYGENVLTMHTDAVKPGQKVLIIDDLLATGGTVEAAIKLVEKLKGEVVGAAFVVELTDLKGRDKIKGIPYHTILKY